MDGMDGAFIAFLKSVDEMMQEFMKANPRSFEIYQKSAHVLKNLKSNSGWY